MKNNLKDFFYFSRRDRNGIIILLILILIVLFLKIFNFFDQDLQKDDYSKYEEEINEFIDSLKVNEKNDSINKIKYDNSDVPFPIKQKFIKKDTVVIEDKKIYNYSKTYTNNIIIELNSADSIDLKKINGIGNVLSKRIVKYRNYLGGFYCIDQLKEVYGIDDQLCENIKSQFTIDTLLINRISINNIDEFNLSKHPYISKYNAKAIISFREFNKGEIQNLSDLLKNNILPDSIYIRIHKYLSIK